MIYKEPSHVTYSPFRALKRSAYKVVPLLLVKESVPVEEGRGRLKIFI